MSITDIFSRKRRHVRGLAAGLIRQGLLPLADIPFHVSLLVENEFEEEEIEAVVEATWHKLRGRPGDLGAVTPIDRLDRAFEALKDKGIMARHYPQDGRAEGYSFIAGELASAKKQGHEFHGFCFYDERSASDMRGGSLSFSFGVSESAPTYARLWPAQIAVGETICETLAGEGFEVSWGHNPGEVIRISGVDWHGRRDGDGNPVVQTGARFDVAASGKSETGGPVVRGVFVAAPTDLPLGHEFVAAVADAKSGASYGTPANAGNDCSAADYTSSRDIVFDLVAAPTGTRGLMVGRDIVRECDLLVELTPAVQDAQKTWWDSFEPHTRLLVVTQGVAASEHDGSLVFVLDLASKVGLDEVLKALERAAAPRGPDEAPRRLE